MNRTEETEILREALAASVGDVARLPLAERLQWLAAVQASLTAAEDASHALDIARDAAWRLGQAHGITVAQRDHGSCRLLPTAGGDLPCPALDAICAEAAQHGRCVMINHPDSAALRLPDPLRSLLLVPAGRSGSRTIGVCWYRPCPVDEDNRVLLEMLCRTTAAALDQLDIETRSRMNDQRFRVLVEGVAQAIWEAAPDGAAAIDSPTWRAWTGQSVEEMLGHGWMDAIHPEDRRDFDARWQDIRQKRSPADLAFRLRRADGSWSWTDMRTAPLFNDDGSVQKWACMNMDITDRKCAEEVLHRSETRFRALAEASPALIWQLDPAGNVVYLNPRYTELSGRPKNTLMHAGWRSLLHPEDAPAYLNALSDARRLRQRFQCRTRVRSRDGAWCWLESHGMPFFTGDGGYAGHVCMSIDISDAVAAEKALRDADRRKDEFLATLAHELRNPLAPLCSAMPMMGRPNGARLSDRLQQMMSRQLDYIVRLVDDLMDISRITRGRIALRRAPTALAEVLQGAVETSMPLVESARHRLNRTPVEADIMLDADAVRLTQVFANLLNNAARYTSPGGQIWLHAYEEENMAIVSVRDNGIGISPQMLPRVFDIFSQEREAASQRQGGLGIGLTLVANLVHMHGGSVEARSAGLGLGSEFIVRLPKMPKMAQAEEHDASGGGATEDSTQRVLVVDDNRDAAETLSMLLEFMGSKAVRVAHDGPSALATMEDFQPDVVLLDIGMPGMDGNEVARRIREQPRFAATRLVALTGWGQEEDRKRTQESGFDHHLTKPVDIAALQSLLSQL
ncbi:PAS domain S-box protein [Noviherbaspirillum sp. 1P10PC]|uniref:PAS domain S-box protein n=1 Tax=Noviherbaspirillum sp. 1P10PC TaxID=3132292 RepID=UPI0039A25EDE